MNITSKELRTQLNQDGYCVVPNFFDMDQLNEIQKNLKQIVSAQIKKHNIPDTNNFYSTLQSLYQTDLNLYLSTIRALGRSYAIYMSFCTQKVFKLVQDLGIEQPNIPTSPVFHLLSDKLKIPNGYFGQGVHQDWTSMQGSLNSIIAWVALTPVTESNFPIDVIPKSHLRGLLPGEPLQDYYKIGTEYYAESDFAPLAVNAGDAVIFSSFLVHRSSIEGKSGFRMATSFRFDDTNEESFIDRGYPTAYKRSVERQIVTPNFPTIDMIHKQYR